MNARARATLQRLDPAWTPRELEQVKAQAQERYRRAKRRTYVQRGAIALSCVLAMSYTLLGARRPEARPIQAAETTAPIAPATNQLTAVRLADSASLAVSPNHERGLVMQTARPAVIAEPPRKAAVPRESTAAIYARATTAERLGDVTLALRLFGSIVDERGSDPMAAPAAFERGRLYMDSFADCDRALLAFAKVERLAPQSPLVDDALARRDRCLVAQGKREAD